MSKSFDIGNNRITVSDTAVQPYEDITSVVLSWSGTGIAYYTTDRYWRNTIEFTYNPMIATLSTPSKICGWYDSANNRLHLVSDIQNNASIPFTQHMEGYYGQPNISYNNERNSTLRFRGGGTQEVTALNTAISYQTYSAYRTYAPLNGWYYSNITSGDLCEMIWLINVCVFENINDAIVYVNTGKIGESILNRIPEVQENPNRYHLFNWLYTYSQTGEKNLVDSVFRNYIFDVNAKPYLYLDSELEPYNLVLVVNSEFVKYTTSMSDIHNWIEASEPDRTNFSYGEFYHDEKNYVALISTNIPIFESKEIGEQYERGEIGTDKALNNGDSSLSDSKKNLTGEEIDEVIPDDINFNVGYFNSTYILNSENMEAIAGLLMSNDTSIIELIKNGVYLWGNNPIDVIMDCYLLPFNPASEFGFNTHGKHVKFGNFDATEWESEQSLPQMPALMSEQNNKEIINEYLLGTFNDYRDITSTEYVLYLPFAGFIKLDPTIYVFTQLKVTAKMDLHSHTLKYYIMSNDKIVESYECSVGVEIALSGTDYLGKMQANVNAINQQAQAITSVGSGIASGDITKASSSLVNGAISLVNSVNNINKDASINIKGNYSPNTAVFDVKYPYLIIVTHDTIKPANLNEQYNYPSYFIDTIGKCVGYVVADNVKLNTDATDPERNEILSLISSGIYV